MKPPPRKRSKPRSLSPVPEPRRPAGNVKQALNLDRAEQRRLLNGLKRLGRTSGGNQDIDYASLEKSVPTRSIPEIHAVVESLKNKVISCASSKLKKDRYEEKKLRKPIAVWTCLASALAGTHEESISTAFSQMLIVASTEPRTLRNCDPQKIYRPAQGERPGTNTTRPLQVVKTPAPAMGSAYRAPNSKIPGTSPAATSTSTSLSAVPSCQPASQTVSPVTGAVNPSSVAVVKDQQPSEQHPTTISTTSTLKSTSSSSHTPLSSPATGLPPVPSTAPSSAASSCSATSSGSTPGAAVQLGHTSKSVTQDHTSPRWLSVESVDFEKLYRYLGLIHKPNNECQLTPMESAILVDLLMSLQEELPHLDCNKLHKHLIQVHQRLTSPADSKAAGELFRDLKDRLCAQRAAPSGPDSTSQQNTAGTSDDSDVTDSGGKKLQPDEAESQSSKNNNTLSQSEDEDVMGLCPPPQPFHDTTETVDAQIDPGSKFRK